MCYKIKNKKRRNFRDFNFVNLNSLHQLSVDILIIDKPDSARACDQTSEYPLINNVDGE